MIDSVRASDENTVAVSLKDGRTQIITVHHMERDDITVHLQELKGGRAVREELAQGR
jgi:hypothetical protein